MNVMNYATRDVPAIAPSESIDRAIKLMEERGVHHLVVCRNGRVVGMISDRDAHLDSVDVLRRTSGQPRRRTSGTGADARRADHVAIGCVPKPSKQRASGRIHHVE